MPAVLELLQSWEQERWNLLIGIVKSYKTIQDSLPGSLEKQASELQSVIDKSNLEEDLKEVIANCKKEKEDEKLEYVQYKSKHEDVVSATSSAPSTSSTSTTAPDPSPAVVEKSKESSFSSQTAEEKIESQKNAKPVEDEAAKLAEKKKKEEESKKKAESAKSDLFGSDKDEDLFQ